MKTFSFLLAAVVTFALSAEATKWQNFPEGYLPYPANLFSWAGEHYVRASNMEFEGHYLGYFKYSNEMFLRSDKKVTWKVKPTGLFSFKLKNTYMGRDGEGDFYNGWYVALDGYNVKLVEHEEDASDLIALFKEDGSDGENMYLTSSSSPRFLNGEIKKLFLDEEMTQRFKFQRVKK